MHYITESELIKKYKISPRYKILDIGGSMKQHNEINIHTLVDIFHPEKVPYYPSKLLAMNFVQLDITKEKLPFKKHEFDFCLCTHTLEDLHNPFLAMDEIQRVAKRGVIITPSRGFDMVFDKFNLTNWMTGARRIPGMAHHKWFFEKNGKKLKIITKNYPVLYTHKFHVTNWTGETEMIFYWENKFDYQVEYGINMHNLIKNYNSFLNRNKGKLTFSRVLFFIDNPINLLKEWIKLLLNRRSKYI